MADNHEEANKWIKGFEKIISNMRNLNHLQKSEQYPWQRLKMCSRMFFYVSL